ncbi:hypothetical protein KAOT1_21227 [Kordia algicida OT-1]|uniref:Uncharacterized protein n=1 Tax=Kordia algicida OT-1 TaxID=391587 RepID=A9DMK2_9FLAO|nr:hypothetical protein KAOT1_21227 [Kordia algicida OT-1]
MEPIDTFSNFQIATLITFLDLLEKIKYKTSLREFLEKIRGNLFVLDLKVVFETNRLLLHILSL